MPVETYTKSIRGLKSIVTEYGEASQNCKPVTATEIFANSWQDSRSGTDNPYYKTQIEQGVNATTGFSGTRQFYDVGQDGSAFVTVHVNPLELCQLVRKVQVDGWIVGIPYAHVPISIPTEAALNRALSDFNRSAANLLRPIMGGVVAGELGKTLRMITNPANALRRGIEDYYKALKKVPRKASATTRKKALVDTYLEHTFGWTPLMADIQGGLETLKRFQARKGSETIKLTGYGREDFTGFSQGSVSWGILRIDFSEITRGRAEVKVFGAVRTKSYGSDASLPDNLGFMPDNWVPTAWELLPYSFLIDYFTNIGTIIDAWSMVNGRVPWACSVTRVSRRTSRIGQNVNTGILGSSYRKSGIVPSKVDLVSRTVNRVPRYSTVPSLDFRMPGFGTKQMLNIASLLYSKEVKRPFY